jgi:hypothetical protein
MTNSKEATKQQVLVRKEKRARQVRITEKTYNELAKLGDVTDDFEDVIARLLKFYKEEHRKQK